MRVLECEELNAVSGGIVTTNGTPSDITQLEVGATGMGDDYHYTGVEPSGKSGGGNGTISDATAEQLVNCVAGITAGPGANSYDCIGAMIGAATGGR